MGKKTPLYQAHVDAGAKMVDFGGWDMPIHYGSQLDEHRLVRRDAGMFDVSHMRIVDLDGGGAGALLRRVLANNVDKLKSPGKALYTCMLNPEGGIIDDLIAYRMRDDWFRLVVNAATADGDLDWLRSKAEGFADVRIQPRTDLAMIAVQGPNSRDKALNAVDALLGPAAAASVRGSASVLDPFSGTEAEGLFIARTGYTGEDGFEIAVDASQCMGLWAALLAAGVGPCGLGARDTLRLEAGMNLYGSDMDQTTTPLESGLGWTVGWEPPEREFIGRAALEAQRSQGVTRKLVGLLLLERGVLRGHQKVYCADGGAGDITSGSFSPTLSRSIAFARVPAGVGTGDVCQVDVRGKRLDVRVVKYPFVRNGKSCIETN